MPWQESYYLPSYLVNPHLEAKLSGICYFLQEAAGNHATHHNMGYFDMQAKQQFWVLNRLRVQMQRFPKWKETIHLKTWVSNMKGPFSYRQFSLLDNQQEEIGSASTLWVLLDAESRRPTRIPHNTFPIIEALPTCGLPDKLTAAKGFETDYSVLAKKPFYKVLPSDLDMINHVNNVKYVEWAENYLHATKPAERYHFMEVNYMQETHLADPVFH